jgi:hypothetical protein
MVNDREIAQLILSQEASCRFDLLTGRYTQQQVFNSVRMLTSI